MRLSVMWLSVLVHGYSRFGPAARRERRGLVTVLCFCGSRGVTEHFAVLHVQHTKNAVLIQAVAAR